jgi:hypothetical protein
MMRAGNIRGSMGIAIAAKIVEKSILAWNDESSEFVFVFVFVFGFVFVCVFVFAFGIEFEFECEFEFEFVEL